MKDVENYIRDILKTRKIHFTLIDPDEQTPEEALEIAMTSTIPVRYCLKTLQFQLLFSRAIPVV